MIFRTLLLALLIFSGIATASAQRRQIFSGTFQNKLAKEWKFVGGEWAVKDGRLEQTDSGPTDPKKAILMVGNEDEDSMNVVMTAKLRLNGVTRDPKSRVGISVCSNPDNGYGLNLVFHDGKLQFIHDYVVWGEGCDFSCESGKWYWMKLWKRTGEMRGKAWKDGEREPADWMVTWKGFDTELTGFPGLNGGSYGGNSVSFAQVDVEVEQGGPPPPGFTTLSLDGDWTVTPLPLDATYLLFTHTNVERLPARVPGEIHLDLMRAGRMEDPDIGDNARSRCRWPEGSSWWYAREFVAPPGFLDQDRQTLAFDGIDLCSQIYLNGILVGSSKDAMSSFAFDVKDKLKQGTNQLVVRVTSGTELFAPGSWDAKPMSRLYAVRDTPHRQSVRKPPFIYGWDWCDPLPNIGLWRDVRLESHDKVTLRQVRLDTVIHDKDVSLQGEVTLDNLNLRAERNCVLELSVDPPGGDAIVQRRQLNLDIGHNAIPCSIAIPHPQLWWPNGMGAQRLYRLTARVLCGNVETDRRVQTIGLRTVELDRSRLPGGNRFCFKVNGRDVFCKGGNWAPPDLIAARIEPARYEQLVTDAKEAHFTMFRVNGAGTYPGDAFYDACDRAGILVWQDFTYACSTYPADAEFMALAQQEADTLVDRLHWHPSLALWCGNNECLTMIGERSPRPDEIGGLRIWREIIPDICNASDPCRPFIPGSPVGGATANSETAGDCHWWGLLMSDDVSRVQPESTDLCRSPFVSEYGIIAPCDLESVNEFLKPEDRNRESLPWKIHSNVIEGGWVAKGIRYHYGEPNGLSLAQYILYGQMIQAIMHGAAMDAFRFRKLDSKAECEGALMWSYNDCWGEMGWAVVDHYLRPKAAYYAVKRSCAPVKVIVRARDRQLVTRVVNDTLQSQKATVRYGWFRLDGSARELKEASVTVPADGMIEVASTPVPAKAERNPSRWLYAAVMSGKGIEDDQSIWLLAPQRELALAKPDFASKLHANGILEVTSPVYCHAVHLDDGGAQILDDNYFDLLPGIPQKIRVNKNSPSGEYKLAAVPPIAEK
ncbi:MAG TPA: glycoside hydrolase family 2 protein [Verrucomicrobiae bacterium]|nr:glycoside hydrolase family 2 protein [Verrucomicrobiae bacterium]